MRTNKLRGQGGTLLGGGRGQSLRLFHAAAEAGFGARVKDGPKGGKPE